MTGFSYRSIALIVLITSLAACQTVPEGESTSTVVATASGSGATSASVRPRPRIQQPRLPRPAAPEIQEADNETAELSDLWARIVSGFTLHEAYHHPDIEEALAWYVENPRYFERIAQRAAPYLYLIYEEVESRGLPAELALLPVVESAFDPDARSAENAVGLWQFMAPTARSLGLQSDWWYDGRRDLVASTWAALDYLEFLYDQFDNDWLLALAAYNAGEGNVRRALRRARAGGRNTSFWSLRLPEETRNHVPRLLAVTKLIEQADQYGIEMPALENEVYLDEVALDFQIDLGVAAGLAGLDESQLRLLNPGYLRGATHPVHPQTILLPVAIVDRFEDALAALPADQRIAWARYQIRRGDTLGSIARRFDTNVSVLQSINGLSGTRIIAGQSLLVPGNPAAGASLPAAANTASNVVRSAPTSYRVRRGDTLWEIARHYSLDVNSIAEWNEITLDSILHPGQILLLQPADEVVHNTPGRVEPHNYEVVRGDSLDRIARSFGVSVAELLLWNELEPDGLIYPGQFIRILSIGADLN